MKPRSTVSSGRWRRMLFGAAVLAIVAAGAVGCGSDSKKAATPSGAATAAPAKASAEVQALHQAFAGAIEKWNAKDLDGFVANFTEKGLISSFGEPGKSLAEAKASLQGFFASQPLKNPTFSQERISGDVGTMDAVFQLGPTLLHSKFTLARAGAGWKLDGEASDLPVDVPAGASKINVDLNEFAFGVDPSGIAEAKGQFALVANNVGKQGHELAISRIPAGVVVADLLKQFASAPNGEVAGVSFIAGTGADPGQQRNLVFAEPLERGRYLLICFRPDTAEGPEGTPHAMKGMVKDFTIN